MSSINPQLYGSPLYLGEFNTIDEAIMQVKVRTRKDNKNPKESVN